MDSVTALVMGKAKDTTGETFTISGIFVEIMRLLTFDTFFRMLLELSLVLRIALNIFCVLLASIASILVMIIFKLIVPFAIFPPFRSSIKRAVQLYLSTSLFTGVGLIIFGLFAITHAALANAIVEMPGLTRLALAAPFLLLSIFMNLALVAALFQVPKLSFYIVSGAFEKIIEFASEATSGAVSLAKLTATFVPGAALLDKIRPSRSSQHQEASQGLQNSHSVQRGYQTESTKYPDPYSGDHDRSFSAAKTIGKALVHSIENESVKGVDSVASKPSALKSKSDSKAEGLDKHDVEEIVHSIMKNKKAGDKS